MRVAFPKVYRRNAVIAQFVSRARSRSMRRACWHRSLNHSLEASVPIFAISTFDTDYVLVPEVRLTSAIRALQDAGHTIT